MATAVREEHSAHPRSARKTPRSAFALSSALRCHDSPLRAQLDAARPRRARAWRLGDQSPCKPVRCSLAAALALSILARANRNQGGLGAYRPHGPRSLGTPGVRRGPRDLPAEPGDAFANSAPGYEVADCTLAPCGLSKATEGRSAPTLLIKRLPSRSSGSDHRRYVGAQDGRQQGPRCARRRGGRGAQRRPTSGAASRSGASVAVHPGLRQLRTCR